jgi:hypothetical protein
MGKKLKRKRSHHGPAETGPRRPRSALPYPGAAIYVSYVDLPNHGVPRYTRVHLGRMMAAGLFPPAYQLSPNRIGWLLSDLETWKQNRPLARVLAVKGAVSQIKAQAQPAPPQAGVEQSPIRRRAPPDGRRARSPHSHGLAAKP